MPCDAYEARPDARADWCRRYAYHIDRAGRFCRQCRETPAFRAMLSERATLHKAAVCGAIPETMVCPVFGLLTDAAQCQRCHTDPLFRNFLYGQAQVAQRPNAAPPHERPVPAHTTAEAAKTSRDPTHTAPRTDATHSDPSSADGWQGATPQEGGTCMHRGATIRTETRRCCGSKTRDIVIFSCAKRGQAHEGVCLVCPWCSPHA